MEQHTEARIASALAAIEARFGAGVARRLREHRPAHDAPAVPTGSLALDRATGLGGLPRGHLAEYIGDESSGRTTLVYAALAATQRAGGIAALIDAEGSADAESLLAAGVALDALLVAQPVSAADALLILTILADCRGFDLVALCAIPALRHLAADRLRTADDHTVAAPDLGRLLARGLRVLTVALRESPTAIAVVNEPLPPADADRLRSSGGLALAHFAALRLAIAPLAALPAPFGEVPGLRVAVEVEKNKLGAPGGRVELDLWAGRGLDQAAELLRLGLEAGALARDWRGYRLGGLPLGHRPADAAATLLGDPALASRVRAAILAFGSPTRVA
jgi:recombination protein RecA